MRNSISRDFSLFSLIRFAIPSIMMMVFTSLYTTVDGVFVSRILGTTALSAVNIFYPVYGLVMAVGIMLASGGSAVIARKLGEGNAEEARENFSLMTLTGTIVGLAMAIASLKFMGRFLNVLGAEGDMFPLCMEYATTFVLFSPFTVLQMLFQYFFVTSGRPGLGLFVTVLGGISNMVLDYLFMVTWGMGISGAALASGIGMTIPAVFGLGYFLSSRTGDLYIVRPRMDLKVLRESCLNGSSEMVGNLALSVVTFMFNIIMMRLIGEDGVAAITIALHSQFVLCAIFFGFSIGVSPVISFNYGSGDSSRTRRVFRYSMVVIATISLASYLTSVEMAPLLIKVFVAPENPVFAIALKGFGLFGISFLFAGVNIFTSAMFTALSNGKVSAMLSFMRTFVFISIGLTVLPRYLDVDGVWISMAVAEFFSFILCVVCLFALRKKYRYA